MPVMKGASPITQETDKDEVLVTLKNQIIKGWPQMRDDCPFPLRAFWSYRDELSILDGLVLKGTRIIVPRACHAKRFCQNYMK